MRRLLVLAPLLLASCSLLFPASVTTSTTHDGYALSCTSTDGSWFETCTRLADDIATQHRSQDDAPIVSISLTDGRGGSLCVESSTGPDCEDVPLPGQPAPRFAA